MGYFNEAGRLTVGGCRELIRRAWRHWALDEYVQGRYTVSEMTNNEGQVSTHGCAIGLTHHDLKEMGNPSRASGLPAAIEACTGLPLPIIFCMEQVFENSSWLNGGYGEVGDQPTYRTRFPPRFWQSYRPDRDYRYLHWRLLDWMVESLTKESPLRHVGLPAKPFRLLRRLCHARVQGLKTDDRRYYSKGPWGATFDFATNLRQHSEYRPIFFNYGELMSGFYTESLSILCGQCTMTSGLSCYARLVSTKGKAYHGWEAIGDKLIELLNNEELVYESPAATPTAQDGSATS